MFQQILFYPFFVSYCLSPEAKATSGQRHYNCQLPLLLLYSLLLLARCEVLRLTEADRSKRPVIHLMSIGSPSPGPPGELETNADTRNEEPPTFIKN